MAGWETADRGDTWRNKKSSAVLTMTVYGDGRWEMKPLGSTPTTTTGAGPEKRSADGASRSTLYEAVRARFPNAGVGHSFEVHYEPPLSVLDTEPEREDEIRAVAVTCTCPDGTTRTARLDEAAA